MGRQRVRILISKGYNVRMMLEMSNSLQKFLPGENFANFATCSLLAKFLSVNFLSSVNDYIEDMVTLTALAKIGIFHKGTCTWAW